MSQREMELLARLEGLTAGLERQVEESQRELDHSREQQAAEARRGELGRDWQRVQSRIDAGRTTLAAVFSGEDDTPEARALVETARERVAELGRDLPPEVAEELAEVEADRARLDARVESTRPQITITTPEPVERDDPHAPQNR